MVRENERKPEERGRRRLATDNPGLPETAHVSYADGGPARSGPGRLAQSESHQSNYDNLTQPPTPDGQTIEDILKIFSMLCVVVGATPRHARAKMWPDAHSGTKGACHQ